MFGTIFESLAPPFKRWKKVERKYFIYIIYKWLKQEEMEDKNVEENMEENPES
mgnify:CR=1 FL=1